MMEGGLDHWLAQCAPQVSAVTMAAIVRVESGGNPLALNINGPRQLTRQPKSRDEAVTWASWLVAQGHSVDMGLAQVNSGNLERLGVSVAQMYDPCANLAAGARILTEFYGGAAHRYGEGQVALQAALSAYNTGNHLKGLRNGYVDKVRLAAYRPWRPISAATGDLPSWSAEAGVPRQPMVHWARRPGS